MQAGLSISCVTLFALGMASLQSAEAVPREQNIEGAPVVQLRGPAPMKPANGAAPPIKPHPEAAPSKQKIESAPGVQRHEAAPARTEVAKQRQYSETATRRRRHEAASESEPNYVKPTMEYDEIIDPSKKRTISTMVSAEFAIRARRSDRAIELARRAMKRDPDDIEIHLALAEALDLKLEEQTEKDPRIFEECIKEYLIVMRNGVGMEKGTNFRGIGILDHMFGDEEHHFLAKARLKFLTGYAPKPWESNEKYLKKVLHPAQTDVKGRILKHSE